MLVQPSTLRAMSASILMAFAHVTPCWSEPTLVNEAARTTPGAVGDWSSGNSRAESKLNFPKDEAAYSAAPPSLTHGATEEGSRVLNADRLTIKFQGYPDLSGDYRVNPDGTVSIPVVGRVPVGDSDTSALEQVLAERVAQVTGRQGFVTVEIAQYKPVFVTGFVTTPGSVPWRPGMMVLQAVAMSGGTFRAFGDKGGFQTGDAESTRVQRATDDLKRTLAGLARLRSEQAGSDSIIVPDRLKELASEDEVKSLIEAQRSSFSSRKAAIESQTAMLKRGIATTELELKGLREQALRLKEQLRLRTELKEKIDDMFKRGIVRADRQLEELARIADLEEKSTNVSVAITRGEGSLVQMNRELTTLEQDRRAAVDTEILKLERDAAQLEIELASARTAFSRITGASVAPTPASTSNGLPPKSTIEYNIVRGGLLGSQPEPATQLTVVRPGDIVVVTAK